jgi:hypothetical protein
VKPATVTPRTLRRDRLTIKLSALFAADAPINISNHTWMCAMPAKPENREVRVGSVLEPLETPYSRLLDSTTLIDLRKHPRFDTCIAARAVAENGEPATAVLTNLSRTGLQLRVDNPMMKLLFADRGLPARDGKHLLRVEFTLQYRSTGPATVEVRCETVYTRHDDNDTTTLIGMKFVAFNRGEEALADYIRFRRAR